jgi:serine/threonine protein kinase
VSLRKIADYTIIRELGRGGMGAVFEALSPTGATVALKTVTWPETADARARWEAIERFQREARAARALSHPNICQVLDFGAHQDSLFIVMELLDGQSLRELIDLAGAIKPERAIGITLKVAEALAYAHDEGVIHRDIKPGNIMIMHGGQVKLTDFGLASVVSETTLTEQGSLVGTLSYISPEQLSGEKVDARSDIFSLGATSYEMLTGVRAFPAQDRAAVMQQILTQDPPPVPGLPAQVSETLARCLRKQPEERFQSAREVVVALVGHAPSTGATRILPLRTPSRAPAPTPAAEASVPDVTPPPTLESPEAEEADVRARANFHWEANLQEDRGELELGERSSQEGAALEHGAYVVTGEREYRLYAPELMPEFIFEGRATKLKGADWADWPFVCIVYGLEEPGSRFAVACVDDGDIVVNRLHEGTWSVLAHARGQGQVNSRDGVLIKLVRRGASLHAFVNNEHVLTVADFKVRLGRLLLQNHGGGKMAWSLLRVDGVDLNLEVQQAFEHRRNLEEREARQLLGHVARYYPSLGGAAQKLQELHPDRRDTVLIVVGGGLVEQLTDGIAAGRLREYINERGRGHETRWAAVVTDVGVLGEERGMDCPVIALGFPEANRVTARLAEELPSDPGAPGWSYLRHDLAHAGRRIALWGQSPIEGAPSIVDYFISSGLLDRFLEVVWADA